MSLARPLDFLFKVNFYQVVGLYVIIYWFFLLIGKKYKVFNFTHRSITESGRLKVDTFPPVPSGTTRMFGLKEIIECFRVVEIVEVV